MSSDKDKHILIVCWDFPPNNAIGGRRWAKIAKSLLRMDYTVSVIGHEAELSQEKPRWISHGEFSRIKFYGCRESLLTKWLNDYTSWFKAIKIRAAGFLLNLFYKGTIFDRTVGIEKRFLKLAQTIIKEQSIQTVFVTGAPFNLLYYAAQLRIMFPQIKLVGDYRDPWIHAQNYGMKGLSPRRKRQELEKQNFVFEQFDIITAPNAFLLEEIKQTYTGKSSKIARFVELQHAFDPDDVIVSNGRPLQSQTEIRLIYGGTLYIGIEKYLEFFNEALSYLKSKLPGKTVKVSFFTQELAHKKLFRANEDCVSFAKPVGDEIFSEIVTSDYILIFLSEHNKNYVTSKFFEFLPYNKPYLYIGPKGFVSDKIEKEGLGYFIKSVEDLYLVLNNPKDKNLSAGDTIKQYSFDAVTRNFILNITKN